MSDDPDLWHDPDLWLGRDEQPISREEAMKAFQDDDARRVAYDFVNGHGVSTVWLVFDHSWGEGPPLIFETMIFSRHGDCPLNHQEWRYATETAALAGHDQAVALARDADCEEFDWSKAERCPNCGYPDYDDVQCHLCEGRLALAHDEKHGQDDESEQSPPDEPH